MQCKFHENSTKIEDFLLMAMFSPCPIFYASPSTNNFKRDVNGYFESFFNWVAFCITLLAMKINKIAVGKSFFSSALNAIFSDSSISYFWQRKKSFSGTIVSKLSYMNKQSISTKITSRILSNLMHYCLVFRRWNFCNLVLRNRYHSNPYSSWFLSNFLYRCH